MNESFKHFDLDSVNRLAIDTHTLTTSVIEMYRKNL